MGFSSNERKPKIYKRSSDDDDPFVREEENQFDGGRKGKSAQKSHR